MNIAFCISDNYADKVKVVIANWGLSPRFKNFSKTAILDRWELLLTEMIEG